MSRPVRMVLMSTLYPSAARPLHGVFVETRLRELLRTGQVDARVVAPVPWFPSRHPRWGEHARMAQTPRREERHGVAVWHPRYALPPKVGMTLAPLLLALGAAPTLRRWRREGFAFDLIDAHYYYPDGVAAALLGRWFGVPVTITARGTDINLIPEFAWPRRMIRWASEQAAASVGVSAALVRRMADLGFDPARLKVWRNGVDLARFAPMSSTDARRQLGLAGQPVLLTVGNLHEHKGQWLALHALAALRQQRPQAMLVVIGAGPDLGALQALSHELGVAEAVHWAGQVPNEALRPWYSAADLLILGSSREGWPNVLLEAMACGTPVVATDVGGVREIVREPDTGRVVVQRTPAAFAAAVADLLQVAPCRDAVRQYASQFGWDETSRAQLAFFRALAGLM